MSVDHVARLNGVIKAYLKTIALGQPVGYAISPGTVPVADAQGNMNGIGAGWHVIVSIPHPRPVLVDNDLRMEIASSFPLAGVLPPDRLFCQVAEKLFANCMEERDKITSKPAAVGMDLTGMQR